MGLGKEWRRYIMALVKPLDFEKIFINYFAGSAEIFIVVAMIFFAYLGARFRMPSGVFGMFMALFIILLAGFNFDMFLIPLIVVLVLGVYWIFSKVIKY
jgi:hypothetical protein